MSAHGSLIRSVAEAGKRLVRARRRWTEFRFKMTCGHIEGDESTAKKWEQALNRAIRAHDAAVDALIAFEARKQRARS